LAASPTALAELDVAILVAPPAISMH